MSYNYQTQWDSPNFTPFAQVAATWGRGRTYEAIAIHWWGDPNTNPSYEGVIATLCNPARQASAHLVATGTGRRVAQLVNFDDASWATNSANPYTISIECDPRCREEDYDVVAEVIAQIRDAFGDLPLVPHKQFAATVCPGNYNLAELDRRARLKDGSGDWGDVKDKYQQPAPPPAPTVDTLYRLVIDGKQVAAYSVEKNAYDGWVNYGSHGTITYQGSDITQALVDKYKPAPVPEVSEPSPTDPTVTPPTETPGIPVETDNQQIPETTPPVNPLPTNPKEDNVQFTKGDLKKMNKETQALLDSNEFHPVISDRVKTVAYFSTDLAAIGSTFGFTILAILGSINPIDALTVNAAVMTALLALKQTFRLSSKKQ